MCIVRRDPGPDPAFPTATGAASVGRRGGQPFLNRPVRGGHPGGPRHSARRKGYRVTLVMSKRLLHYPKSASSPDRLSRPPPTTPSSVPRGVLSSSPFELAGRCSSAGRRGLTASRPHPAPTDRVGTPPDPVQPPPGRITGVIRCPVREPARSRAARMVGSVTIRHLGIKITDNAFLT